MPARHSDNLFLCLSLCDLQIENAAEEPRVLCIIQDTTNSKTVNERLTINLPASTSLSKLHEDVAHKAGYVIGTFDLAWGNLSTMVSQLKQTVVEPFLPMTRTVWQCMSYNSTENDFCVYVCVYVVCLYVLHSFFGDMSFG